MKARTEPVAIFCAVMVSLLGPAFAGTGGDFIIEPGDIHPQLDGKPRSYHSEWDVATPLKVDGEVRAKSMHVSVFLYVWTWADDETYHDQDFIEICFDVEDDGYNRYDGDDNCLRVYRTGERYESYGGVEQGPSNDWSVAIKEHTTGRWYAEYKIKYDQFNLKIGKPKNMGLMLRSWDKNKGKIDIIWPTGIDYYKPMFWGNLSSSVDWRLHPSLVSRPKLLEESVSPTSGRYPTNFSFSIVYEDWDGDAPVNVSVFFVDEFRGQMEQIGDCDPKEGCLFHYSEMLDPGDYTFFFRAQNRQHLVETDSMFLEVEPEKNYVPEIRDPILESFIGDKNTQHEFGFEYYDEGNQHPVESQIIVSGLGGILMRRQPGCRPEDGCWYYYNERFPPGFYEYYYRASDGYYFITSDRSWFRIEGFSSEPSLSQGGVSPLEGDADTKFVYSVVYRDLDGDYADFVVVNVEEERYAMMTTPDCESFVGCVFSISRRLGNGTHEYFFEASDSNSTVRFPVNGTLSGPTVIVENTTGDGNGNGAEEEAADNGWSFELDDNMKMIIAVAIGFGIFYYWRSGRIKKRKKYRRKIKASHRAAH